MTARFNVWLTNHRKGAFYSRPHAEIKKNQAVYSSSSPECKNAKSSIILGFPLFLYFFFKLKNEKRNRFLIFLFLILN